MSAAEVASLMVAAAGLLTAIGTLVVSVASLMRLGPLHDAVNGQTAHLVALTRTASFAEGVQAEREAPGAVGKTPTDDVGIVPTEK